ncbi:MAG: class E sortase [Candidatus Dojkabacteria bacterium]
MKVFNIIKTLNISVSILIAVLACFILVMPSMPEIVFALNKNQYEGYAFNSVKTSEVLGEKAMLLPEISKDNVLVIPKIYVNAIINEGVDESTLNLGMWRRPNTSMPDLGGNTVIAAHRFLHTVGSNTFYFLDKMTTDDVILVYWKGVEYVYKVYEVSEAMPEQIEIEYNTKDPILTLYTCEPLWTSDKRLVVKAKLQ